MVPQGGPNTRLNELLDQIRAEFDQEARRSVDYENQSEFVSAVLMDVAFLCILARAMHLRPFFELRLLRAYSIRPQCLKLLPALEKLKFLPRLLERPHLEYILCSLNKQRPFNPYSASWREVKSLTGASLP